ncbi:hypothetical protein JCM10512_2019 [Bacteroides reticulotermitis JCM 10512]|uniref:SusD-like N-terminal domain-containing protein n=1 Tax=Bacteroides reticulotermitis JCM 10512 TaxID=1445607 RepID=W4UR98_9BACE|nr:hypothetical protein JCM10512_2019 [Bacteroides reticulotermitis JCM 10512]
MTAEEKKVRKGEAKMIIAYHYVQMLRNLGGMPWIDHAYKPEDDVRMSRMTIEETVEKICGLIDEAAGMLPWGVNAADDGRMTAAGALALKSRLLLFAASLFSIMISRIEMEKRRICVLYGMGISQIPVGRML